MKKPILPILVFASFPATADVRMDYSDGAYVIIADGFVATGDTNGYALFEAGKDTFVIVDHNEKTYMEVSETFAEDVASAVAEQMEQMLASVPPEQRAMMEQSMKGMMPGGGAMPEPPKVTMNKTGKKDKVAGFSCAEVEIAFDGRKAHEVSCVATPGELGIKAKDFESMAAAMKSMSSMAGREDDTDSEMDFAGMGGIPIRTRNARSGDVDELVSLSKDNIDKKLLDVPAGYDKVSTEDMMMR